MKKEIIICATSVVATLGVTKLPDLLSNATVVTPPATETTVQESTNTQSNDTTNELLEQILVKLDEDETVAEKETTLEKNESVDDSKTENKANSTTNTSQATANTTTQNPTQAKPSTPNNSSSTSSKPTNSQQQTATASSNKNTNTSSSNTTTSKVKTSVARAKEIAIAHVGGGTVTEFSQDFDDLVPNYDATIRHGNAEYDLEISAVDGSILAFDVEYDKVAQKPSSSTSTSNPSNSTSNSTSKPSSKPSNSTSNIKISAAKAKEIAIAQAGGGTVSDFSQDFDDRVPKYEVTVRNGNKEYDFDISAVDGSILSREVDYENDREDDWD